MRAYGPMRFEQVLEPVTGRAVPVFKGEVLRITHQTKMSQILPYETRSTVPFVLMTDSRNKATITVGKVEGKEVDLP